MKKCLSTLLAVCMLLALIPVSAMAADPDMSGTVVNVTAAQAQDVLDGKYGSINGKTINFVEDIADVLELRPGRYEHSNTTYYNYVNYVLETTATPWSENISTVMNSHSHYYRTIQNVTFTANEGVSVAGFECKTGYLYEAGNYDPVRDMTQGVNEPHHRHVTLKNLFFDGLTITGHFDATLYEDGSAFENLTFNNCTFTGTTETGLAAIRLLSDSFHFKNTVVTNCTISDYFQGIYISGIDGAVIENNTIEN